jgi:hypothetical protein
MRRDRKRELKAGTDVLEFHHSDTTRMTRQQVLDLYFMENRAKLIDIAAFLDRVDRAEGDADFRLSCFKEAMKCLHDGAPQRAKNVLLSLSDPSVEPIDKAPGKGAVGAYLAK